MKGYLKVAAIMPSIKVGNVKFNIESIKEEILKANSLGVKIAVLPKFSFTGNNLQSLYLDKNILNDSLSALFNLTSFSNELDMLIVASMPYEHNNLLYEVACVIKSGKILGFIPNKNIKNDPLNGIYFSKCDSINVNLELPDNERNISYSFLFSDKIIFKNKFFTFSVTFDDVFDNINKSFIYANITSIRETINVDNDIRYIKTKSEELSSVIIAASSGPTESSSNFVYFGRSLIAENGEINTKNDILSNHILVSDIDLDKNLIDKYNTNDEDNLYVTFDYINYISNFPSEKLFREFDKTPYINKKVNPYNYSMHIINILAVALAKRLNAVNSSEIVIGLSGGLDSTFALLVVKKTAEFLSLNNSNIHAISLPCFGTTSNSVKNISELIRALDVQLTEINISNAINSHFSDIHHDINNTNVTYENAQARERMQVLMDIANDLNGIVIGTSDLSEIALGFSTYNGDHMSMYNVNGCVPKTLIRYILNAIADENLKTKNNLLLANTLKNILYAPVSPELLPTENGVLIQKTEDILGNYEIHDFILYNYLKYRYDISKIYDLALRTFVYSTSEHHYSEEYIKNCINIFFKKFYKAQYKRSTAPDSPYIGLPSLNKNFDYNIPNDVEYSVEL